jgi:hypothetical protein
MSRVGIRTVKDKQRRRAFRTAGHNKSLTLPRCNAQSLARHGPTRQDCLIGDANPLLPFRRLIDHAYGLVPSSRAVRNCSRMAPVDRVPVTMTFRCARSSS